MHSLTSHYYTLRNISFFVIFKVTLTRALLIPWTQFADSESRCNRFERGHVLVWPTGSYICSSHKVDLVNSGLISSTAAQQSMSTRFIGMEDHKIKAFSKQHAPMCRNNWVCMKLGLKDAIMEKISCTPSPEKTVDRHSLKYLVN